MIPNSYFDELHQAAAAHHRETGRPLVTLSYAQSLDGSLARTRGEPLALSGPESMAFTHRLRGCHDAILVGIGTVLSDDPRLTVRGPAGTGPIGPDPQPVVLDPRFRTPAGARVWAHPLGLWIFSRDDTPIANRAEAVRRGGRLFAVPYLANGRLSLPAVLNTLGSNGIASVMIEGGAAVITSFLAEGLAHRAAITIAPVFIGGLRAPEALQESTAALTGVEVHQTGSDIVVTGAFARR